MTEFNNICSVGEMAEIWIQECICSHQLSHFERMLDMKVDQALGKVCTCVCTFFFYKCLTIVSSIPSSGTIRNEESDEFGVQDTCLSSTCSLTVSSSTQHFI